MVRAITHPGITAKRNSPVSENGMYITLQSLSIGSALISGVLWLYASLIKIPIGISSAWGKLNGVEEMSAGFQKQARWNSIAAFATAFAAGLQGISMLISSP